MFSPQGAGRYLRLLRKGRCPALSAAGFFILSKDGITFYYNVYDIAPYVMGPVKITLPYEMMQHLLSDETMALNDVRNP